MRANIRDSDVFIYQDLCYIDACASCGRVSLTTCIYFSLGRKCKYFVIFEFGRSGKERSSHYEKNCILQQRHVSLFVEALA